MEMCPGYRRIASSLRVIVLGLLLLSASMIPGTLAAPVIIGGPFTLTAPDGSSVSDSSFRGKWMLVFFGYTYCPDTCPTTLSEIAVAMDALGDAASKVQPIFITVDPERDTPDILGQYTAAIDRRIIGLSGTPSAIEAVSEAYGAYSARHGSQPGSDDYLIDHSVVIYVMDPHGTFVRGVAAGTPGAEIAQMMRQLMAKAGG